MTGQEVQELQNQSKQYQSLADEAIRLCGFPNGVRRITEQLASQMSIAYSLQSIAIELRLLRVRP